MKRLGWIKDSTDVRDYVYSKTKNLSQNRLDLRDKMSEIEDQGAYASCGACVVIGALEYFQKTSEGKYQDLSKMFAYYNARLIDNLQNIDAGCSLRAAIKASIKYGTCKEKTWPYEQKNLYKKPGLFTYWFANKCFIGNYFRIKTPDINAIKSALTEGLLVAFGTTLFQSFDKIGKDGIVPVPTEKEALKGGHAMLICGYTDKYFIVRNSWGKEWGDNGYCYFPMEYIKDFLPLTQNYDLWAIGIRAV